MGVALLRGVNALTLEAARKDSEVSYMIDNKYTTLACSNPTCRNPQHFTVGVDVASVTFTTCHACDRKYKIVVRSDGSMSLEPEEHYDQDALLG